MALKRHILLIILMVCACTSTLRAQLVFEPPQWDFGTIREVDGPVSHTFTGENRGDKPLVILDVVSSCGCTTPEFSRRPILPGERAQIVVRYDPANRPGSFTKELGVYSTQKLKIATLTVQGSVTPRPKSTEELYPIDAGGGLRLNSTLCAFSYIYPGRLVQGSVGYINTANRPIALDLRPEHSSGLLKAGYSRTLAPGQRGEINLSYLIPAQKPRYGTVRDVLEVTVDGRNNGTLLMAHGIGVDDPEKTEKPAPKAQLSENMLKFGPVKHASPLQRQSITLSNTGGSELVVRAIESNGHFTVDLAPGRKIAAGASVTFEVTLDPRQQEFGVLTDHLILITNDPMRPMRRLRVTAIIED